MYYKLNEEYIYNIIMIVLNVCDRHVLKVQFARNNKLKP